MLLIEKEQGNSVMTNARAVVDKLMAEHSLHSWVHKQNCHIGVSPEPSLVAQQLPLHVISFQSRYCGRQDSQGNEAVPATVETEMVHQTGHYYNWRGYGTGRAAREGAGMLDWLTVQ